MKKIAILFTFSVSIIIGCQNKKINIFEEEKQLSAKLDRDSTFLPARPIDLMDTDDKFYNLTMLNTDSTDQIDYFVLRHYKFAGLYRLFRSSYYNYSRGAFEYSIGSFNFYIRYYPKSKNKANAYVIKWTNRLCESMLSDYETANRDPLHTNWDIGEFTDSILTNLPKEVITKAFPKFKGKYVKFEYDTIIIKKYLKHTEPDSLPDNIVFQ